MKRIIFKCSIVLLSFFLFGCPWDDEKPLEVASVAEVAVESMIENLGDKADSAWIDNIKIMHQFDQQVCVIVGSQGKDKSESQFIPSASAQPKGNSRALKIADSCCPCSGACCGCIEEYTYVAVDAVTSLSIAPVDDPQNPQKTVNAEFRKDLVLSGAKVWDFPKNTPNGDYEMSVKYILGDKPGEVKFNVKFENSHMNIDKGDFRR